MAMIEGNPFDAMRSAVSQARAINRAVDDSANSMAMLLKGRLRHVGESALKDLKRELRDFNIHTGRWK